MRSTGRYVALALLLLVSVARGAETEFQYLSGLGKDDPVKWEFICDKGQNANKWSTIGVPSNWELQGFGIYSYGRSAPADGWPRVHGIYKRTFITPATWRERAVFVKFEGVMTDAAVTINGRSAGPVHQGGYYAFKYDITSLLKPAGEKNEIQVDVDDDSMNNSVNRAERRADYWNYAGIFRPVYLEAVPKTFVDRLAVNATADGALSVDVTTSDTHTQTQSGTAASLEMRVLDASAKPVGSPIVVKGIAFNSTANLSGTVPNPRLWTAETPNLYQLEVRLKIGDAVVHTVHQKFGFRTVEVLPGKGLFVNGKRVFLKGVARHSFWPEVYETVLAIFIIGPTTLALVNPKLGKFNVTAKGGVIDRDYFDGNIARPNYLLYLVNDRKLSAESANLSISALKFLYLTTLDCPGPMSISPA